jgi:hypothetical protein
MSDLIKNTALVIQNEYGVGSYENENPVTNQVGVADVIIARNNPARVVLSIALLAGGGTITIRPSLPADATHGLVLSQGQYIRFEWKDDLDLVTREWHAIASGAGQTIYVLEQLLASGPDRQAATP